MAPGLANAAGQAGTGGIEDLLPNDEDLLYEEELLRNPYSLKMWCSPAAEHACTPAPCC